MKIGDYVTRNKYNNDILFKIVNILGDSSILKGVYVRLICSALITDLAPCNDISSFNIKRDLELKDLFYKNHKSGKILHIDSDISYLKSCDIIYQNLGLNSVSIFLEEEHQKKYILHLIELIRPDIIVLTGHDSYNKQGLNEIRNYRNSKNFRDTIIEIRKKYSLDDIFIYAGACGSFFESLISAGANMASSPKRVNIDLYDPAICAIKVATTPFNQIVSMKEIWSHSLSKEEGIQGLETYGKLRILN